jgi:glycosyltransferase involved in cell wall biosynthesis
VWSGTSIDRAARARTALLARSLRARLLLRGPAPLYRRARARGGDLAYLLVSHHGLVRPSALVRFKARTGARFVCLVHDLIPIKHPEYVREGDAQRHRRRIDTVAHLADRVIANSVGTAMELERHFAEAGRTAPIQVAPLGIDLRPAAPPPAAVGTPPYFVYVATIEPRKNHRLLFEVWRQLAAMGGAVPRLVLIGRRGLHSRQIIAAIERSDLACGLVEEHNGLPDAAVAWFVAGAQAALYPSLAEGYGLPVAEALALGVPVLCSDLPELREIGGDVPEYLDPLDRQAWRDAVLNYAQSTSTRRQAQLARLTRWRPPSWEQHFRSVQPLLDFASV